MYLEGRGRQIKLRCFMSYKKSRMTIDIPQSDHKKLKAAASLMGISLKTLVMMSVENFVHKKLKKLMKEEAQLEAGPQEENLFTIDNLFK